jgi:RES domain-containing protein
MPRDTWRIRVDVSDIADLTEPGLLQRHGITELRPTRRQWLVTQPVGDAYYNAGFRGLLAPSAAHDGGQVLAIFRPLPALPGLSTVPPPNRYDDLPPLPTGLRT